jgi:hypothetical protein
LQSKTKRKKGKMSDVCSLVSLVALCNKRHRYFIPSHDNFFGCFDKFEGIRVPNIMVDNGCNTLLLPLDGIILDILSEHYSGVEFGWRIISAGDLSSPVLVISAFCPMMTNWFANVFQFSVKLDHLRFHISYEDAKDIISRRPKNLTQAEILVLEEFCRFAERIEKDTGAKIGKRRKYALLGQAIMKQDFDIFQTPYLTMFVHSNDKLDWSSVKDVAQALWQRFRSDFDSNEEFQNMEDFDHDGEDPLGWDIDAVDEN